LRAVEMTELITNSEIEYESLAIKIAQDADLLKSLKNKLQKNILTSPLFDPVGNTKYIEKAFVEMHRKYLAGEEPDDFSIS
jgi:predicted O-linked N-acetylglucosamine transferase (SPINDLY family)